MYYTWKPARQYQLDQILNQNQKLRPRFLPPWPAASNFHEVNFRTYVIGDGIPGIYFLSIEAGKLLPALLARLFIGLPYIKSDINRSTGIYCSKNTSRNFELKATYAVHQPLETRSALDYWLTERHALFQENGKKLHRIDVHHKPWPLQPNKGQVQCMSPSTPMDFLPAIGCQQDLCDPKAPLN